MVLPYMVTFTINIPQMLAYIPYMDPMGYITILVGFIPIIQASILFLLWSDPHEFVCISRLSTRLRKPS